MSQSGACIDQGRRQRLADHPDFGPGHHDPDANAIDARFELARMDRALCDGADLRRAKFLSVKMKYADFSHAQIDLADFTQADLEGSNLHRASDAGTVWRDANLTDVSRTDPELAEAEELSKELPR